MKAGPPQNCIHPQFLFPLQHHRKPCPAGRSLQGCCCHRNPRPACWASSHLSEKQKHIRVTICAGPCPENNDAAHRGLWCAADVVSPAWRRETVSSLQTPLPPVCPPGSTRSCTAAGWGPRAAHLKDTKSFSTSTPSKHLLMKSLFLENNLDLLYVLSSYGFPGRLIYFLCNRFAEALMPHFSPLSEYIICCSVIITINNSAIWKTEWKHKYSTSQFCLGCDSSDHD